MGVQRGDEQVDPVGAAEGTDFAEVILTEGHQTLSGCHHWHGNTPTTTRKAQATNVGMGGVSHDAELGGGYSRLTVAFPFLWTWFRRRVLEGC